MIPPDPPDNRPEETLPPGLGPRINRLAERAGGKRRLAQAAGIRENQLYRYIREDNVPSLAVAIALAAAGGVRLEWLAYGREPAGVAEPSPDYAAGSYWVDPPTAAGTIGPIRFRADWLRERGIPVEGLVLGEVPDDAMVPALRRGDLVLADGRAPSVSAAGLYLIRLDGTPTIRRVLPRPDGGLDLACDNPAYPATTVPAEQRPNLAVVGQVLWTGRGC